MEVDEDVARGLSDTWSLESHGQRKRAVRNGITGVRSYWGNGYGTLCDTPAFAGVYL